MKFPEPIQNIIGNRPYTVDEIGKSTAKVICFDDMILKIEEQSVESENEHAMMEWLDSKLPVPKVLGYEKEKGMSYLLMSKINGEMSCSPTLLENPKNVVKMLAKGLKMLWSIDISKCPSNKSLDHKLEMAKRNVYNNLCCMEDSEPETFGNNGFENPEKLLQWLIENKPTEELVFSHGDYCLPNIFIQDNNLSGFIDLGRSGVSDKYQDIALCYRSLKHNYDGVYGGKVYKDFDATILFDELGLELDWEKIKYYILLDELF